MTNILTVTGVDMPVASEPELLAFANIVRNAGGADPIEALLPSIPEKDNQCLIANALNFKSQIAPGHHGSAETPEGMFISTAFDWDDGTAESKWCMYLGDEALAAKISEKIGLGHRPTDDYDHYTFRGEGKWAVHLPREIGNAAAAFDDGAAFTEYVVDRQVEG